MTTNQALQQVRGMFGGMTRRQQFSISVGTVVVAAALAVFAHYMNKPPYALLYSGISPADAQDVTRDLSSVNISYDLSADGTSISVPPGDLDRARLELASKGLPHSGQLGFELFDKPDWGGSDFAEQVNYQRALEGELDRTIETIQGVQSARVHITMAHNSLFTTEDRGAKAAVMLTMRTGQLQPDTVYAIQHLVASAVDNLDPKAVAVVDSEGDMPVQNGSDTHVASRLETELRDKLVATLVPVAGADHVRANVNVEYDPSSTDNTQELYDPGSSVLVTSERSNSSSGSAGGAGIPGTASNLPPSTQPQPPGTNLGAQLGLSSTPSQSSESQTYAVSRTLNHVVKPAGSILRITAAVVVDDVDVPGKTGQHRKRTPDEMQQVQQLAAAAIGIDPARGDVLTVSNLPFETSPPETAPTIAWRDRIIRQTPTLLHYGGILALFMLIYVFLMRPMIASFKTAASRPMTAMASGGMTGALGMGMEGGQVDGKRTVVLREQLSEQVRREPVAASRVIQSWMAKPTEENR